jgi:branched-chain amino acid transport system permease protein
MILGAVSQASGGLTFWLQVILVGISTGCIYSLAGMGVVLTYKATGVFNFAHGAVAMIVAYCLWQLASQWHVPLIPAALIALLVIGPGIGLLLERVVFRPLERRGAGQTEKLVATLGIFLLLLGLAYAIWTGTVRQAPALVSSTSIDLGGGLYIGTDQLTVVVLVGVISVALWLLFRFTRIGMEIRAVVDRRELAELSSIPANRVAGLSWALGCGLAGLTGVLLAPQFGLDPFHLTLLVIETFSIAVVARLVSLPVAAGAGVLLLGVLNSLLTEYHLVVLPVFGKLPSGISNGFDQLKPNLSVVILFVALLVLRKLDEVGGTSGGPGLLLQQVGRLRRSARAGISTPRVALLLVAAVIAVVAPLPLDTITLGDAQEVLALIVIFTSIVCITGFCGYITLGQAGFAGIGAYVAARVANALGLPVILAMLVGAVAALVLGLVAGYPALKRRGLFLGLTTLAIGLLAYQFVFSSNVFAGGSGGLTAHRASVFGLSFAGDRAFYWFELFWVVLMLVLARNLRSGRLGRILTAMRDSETATRSIGIDLRRYKLFIFGASAFIAGIGGTLLAQQTQVFTPFAFDPFTSLTWFLVVVVAGVGSLGGAVVGAVLFVMLNTFVHQSGFSDLIFAILALFIGYLPGGSLAGLASQLAARVREPRRLIEAFAEAAATGSLSAPSARPHVGVGNGIRPAPALEGPGALTGVAVAATRGANGSGDGDGDGLIASPFADRVLQEALGSPE